MKRLVLCGIAAGVFAAGAQMAITTKDSLSVKKGMYASILFTASKAETQGVPQSFTFKESGNAPPGMRFESYPCNKPGFSPCPALARADGVFLDGVPQAAGSYSFEITATDPEGNNTKQGFTVKVANAK